MNVSVKTVIIIQFKNGINILSEIMKNIVNTSKTDTVVKFYFLNTRFTLKNINSYILLIFAFIFIPR